MNFTDSTPGRHLLLVDDEESILQALRRMLRRDGYVIHVATSGEQGLAILETAPIGVIVSDQRMPGMTGSEFLSKVKERFPGTIRMVLSGYTELNSITDAINRGAIYKFLTKPWDDDLLRSHIAEGFLAHEMKAQNERLSAINHSMVDAVPDALLLVAVADRKIVGANAAAARLLGYPASQLESMSIDDIEPLPVDRCYWDELSAGPFRALQGVETEYLAASGDLLPVRKTSAAINGESDRVLLLVQDIRRERQAESMLKRSNAELSAVFESTSDGLLMLDADGHLARLNRRLDQRWKFPAEMITAHGGQEMLCWIAQQSTTAAATQADLLAALAQPELHHAGTFERRDGGAARWNANPLLVNDDIVGQVFAFADGAP